MDHNKKNMDHNKKAVEKINASTSLAPVIKENVHKILEDYERMPRRRARQSPSPMIIYSESDPLRVHWYLEKAHIIISYIEIESEREPLIMLETQYQRILGPGKIRKAVYSLENYQTALNNIFKVDENRKIDMKTNNLRARKGWKDNDLTMIPSRTKKEKILTSIKYLSLPLTLPLILIGAFFIKIFIIFARGVHWIEEKIWNS